MDNIQHTDETTDRRPGDKDWQKQSVFMTDLGFALISFLCLIPKQSSSGWVSKCVCEVFITETTCIASTKWTVSC